MRVRFDPSVLSFNQVLDLFYEYHDASIGYPSDKVQYISAIYPTDEGQAFTAKAELERRRAEAMGGGGGPARPPLTVVRDVEEGEVFFPAEAYHQVCVGGGV